MTDSTDPALFEGKRYRPPHEQPRRPDAIIVSRQRLTDWDLEQMRSMLARAFPGWNALLVDASVDLYQPNADGDYEQAEPLPVLDGKAVIAYLDKLAARYSDG